MAHLHTKMHLEGMDLAVRRSAVQNTNKAGERKEKAQLITLAIMKTLELSNSRPQDSTSAI